MRIKELRMSKNLTQEAIAEGLGVSRSAVAMWETGKSKPRADHILKITKMLQCSADDLLA